MNKQEWEKLHDDSRSEYRKRYLDFMYDINNIGRCQNCPENIGYQPIGKLPCGQYHCWVRLHCEGA